MAIYLRVSVGGGIATEEVWSITPNFLMPNTLVAPSAQLLNAAASAVLALTPPTPIRALLSSAANISRCRIEARLEGSDQIITVGEAGSPTVAGSGNATKTFQTSMCFSLRTPLAGGRFRGRLYLPALGANISTTTLRVPSANQTQALENMITWLQQIEDAIRTALSEADMYLAVYSRANGEATVVSRIEVGDVLDTQRRRRDKATETYASAPFRTP